MSPSKPEDKISRFFLSKIDVVQILISELTILCSRMNWIKEIRKEQELNDMQNLYDKCFELISTARRPSQANRKKDSNISGMSHTTHLSDVKEILL